MLFLEMELQSCPFAAEYHRVPQLRADMRVAAEPVSSLDMLLEAMVASEHD